MKKKEAIILAKNEIILAEVATSNNLKDAINKIKRNVDVNRSKVGELEKIILEGVVLPEVGNFEIRSEALTR